MKILLVFSLWIPLVTVSESKTDLIERIFQKDIRNKYREAIVKARNGKYAEAEKMLEELLRKTKNSPDILSNYVIVLAWHGQWGKAVKNYERIPKSYISPRRMYREVGLSYYRLKRYKDAVKVLRKYLETGPPDRDGIKLLVESYCGMGRYGQVSLYIRNTIRKNRKDAPWLKKFLPYIKHQQGVALARKEQFERSLKLMKQAVKESNRDLKVLYDYISILSWAEKYEQAIEEYEKIPVKFKSKTPRYVLHAYQNSLKHSNRKKKAISELKKHLGEVPDDNKAFKSLLTLYIDSWRIKQGRELVKSKLKRDPAAKKWLKPYISKLNYRQALLYVKSDELEKAVEFMDKAVELDPQNYIMLNDYVAILGWAGKHEKAISEFERLPKDKVKEDYLLPIVAGSYKITGKVNKSIEHYQKMLEKNPENINYFNVIANIYMSSGEYEKVISLIKARIKKYKNERSILMPKYYLAIYYQAIILARKGKYQEALKKLKIVVKNEPENKKALYDCIAVLSWANKDAESIKEYEKLGKMEKIPNYVAFAVAGSYYRRKQIAESCSLYKALEHAKFRHLEVVKTLIRLYSENDMYDEGIKFIDRQIANFPGEKKEFEKIKYRLIFKRTASLERQGKLKEYKQELKNIYKDGIDLPWLLSYFALHLYEEGKYEKAIETYNKIPSDYKQSYFLRDSMAKAFRITGDYRRAIQICRETLKENPDDHDAAEGIALAYIEKGDVNAAMKFAREMQKKVKKSDSMALLPVMVYLKTGRDVKAEISILQVLKKYPESFKAKLYLAGVYLRRKQLDKAEVILKRLIKKDPQNIDVLFLKAEWYEAKREYIKAYNTYGKILDTVPHSQRAIDNRYRLLLDLGAVSLAREKMEQDNIKGSESILLRILGDEAVYRIRWLEREKAIRKIEQNIDYADTQLGEDGRKQLMQRTLYDSLSAYRVERDMENIVKTYEDLRKSGKELPYWVIQPAADAYLYLKQPKKSLELYKDVEKRLEAEGKNLYPGNFELQMAMYYNYIDLEEYDKAEKILAKLFQVTSPYRIQRGVWKKNWHKMDIELQKGWLLVYRNKLAEAQKVFEKLLKLSPANTNVKTALAYVYYYRGWPRKARKLYREIVNIDPKQIEAQVGLVYTLYQTDQLRKAEALADKLRTKYPHMTAVKNMKRYEELLWMRTFTTNFEVGMDEQLSESLSFSWRLDQPITPGRNIFIRQVWRRIGKSPESNTDFKYDRVDIVRTEMGFDGKIYDDLSGIFYMSADTTTGSKVGIAGGLTYQFDDHWTASIFYNSYSLNVPGQAFLDGVEGQELSTSVTYRASEDFNVVMSYSFLYLNDFNHRNTVYGRIDKALYTDEIWQTRLALESSFVNYRTDDVNYYSPLWRVDTYLVPHVEHLWYRNYDFAIMDRAWTGVGFELEDQQSLTPAFFARYEQEWQFCDTFSILFGGTYTYTRYGEDLSNGFSIYANLVYRF